MRAAVIVGSKLHLEQIIVFVQSRFTVLKTPIAAILPVAEFERVRVVFEVQDKDLRPRKLGNFGSDKKTGYTFSRPCASLGD